MVVNAAIEGLARFRSAKAVTILKEISTTALQRQTREQARYAVQRIEAERADRFSPTGHIHIKARLEITIRET